MIFKRCKCGKRCENPNHPLWFQVIVKGDRERGPVQKYLHLLPAGATVPTTLTEARPLEAAIKVWVAQGRPAPQPPTGTDDSTAAPAADNTPATAAALIASYDDAYTRKLQGNSALNITARIARELGTLTPAQLFERGTLRGYLDGLGNGPAQHNRHRSRLVHLFHWTRAEFPALASIASPFYNRISNPTGIQERNEGDGRSRRLSPTEEAAIVRALEAVNDGGMMLGRFYCALDCGLRQGELLALKREDVIRNYQGTGTMVIRVHWTTAKTGRTRIVPVVTKRLQLFLNERLIAGAAFIFGQVDGTRCDSISVEWQAALVAAGIDAGQFEGKGKSRRWVWTVDGDLHWHDLRHECGSRLAERNVPLFEIMKLLGHTNLATTQKYLNVQLHSLADNMTRALAGV